MEGNEYVKLSLKRDMLVARVYMIEMVAVSFIMAFAAILLFMAEEYILFFSAMLVFAICFVFLVWSIVDYVKRRRELNRLVEIDVLNV